MNVCLSCGTLLDDPDLRERAFFSRARAGLVCAHCRAALSVGGSWELTASSRALAAEMLRTPIAALSVTHWSQDTAADLRRFLIQQIETHAERRLVTAKLLMETETPAPDPRPLAPDPAREVRPETPGPDPRTLTPDPAREVRPETPGPDPRTLTPDPAREVRPETPGPDPRTLTPDPAREARKDPRPLTPDPARGARQQ